MTIKNFYFRFVQQARSWVLIACSSMAACSIGTPTHSKQFVFETGQQHFEIDVAQYCTYEIGISFSAGNGNQAIKDFFGHARKINMPAIIDVSLTSESGVVLFSRLNFGGDMSEYRYGPNPLKLIAGKVYLEPGKHLATINIKNVDKDFSGFESMFFVSADPKVTCKKKK